LSHGDRHNITRTKHKKDTRAQGVWDSIGLELDGRELQVVHEVEQKLILI
jgi:hypothetical protein